MTSIATERDAIEDAILLALHANSKSARTRWLDRSQGCFDREYIDLGKFCGPDTYPRSCYTFDLSGGDERLFVADFENIVVDPVKAIGNRLETLMLCEDGTLKWSCIVRMKNRPIGIAATTNQRNLWFAYHFRHIGKDGSSLEYIKRPFCLSGGDVCRIKPMGQWSGFDPAKDRAEILEQLALTLSVFEDARRAGSFLATVKEFVELKFPVGKGAYKQFFLLRDAPRNTPTGRRNPIIHFCAEHIRSGANPEQPVRVREHLRGTEEIQIGPLSLKLEPNDGYAHWLPDA